MPYRTSAISFVLLIFLGFGAGYSAYTPLWSPPDEELHFAYCQYIERKHCLPLMQDKGAEHKVSLAFHPPLYYLLGSFFCSSHDPPVLDILVTDDGPGFNRIKHPKGEMSVAHSAYLLRAFTLLLAAGTVCCIYMMALTLFPGDVFLAFAAALFVAANPQFIHISSSISNETLAASLSALYLLLLLRYSAHKSTPLLTACAGIVLGACLLSKTSTLFWLPVTLCVIVAVCLRDLRRLFYDCIIIFGSASLVAGWWYAANWAMLRNLQTSQPWFNRNVPLFLDYVINGSITTFKSFFGYFGALQIPLPDFYFGLYAALLGIGLLGFCKLLMTTRLAPATCLAFAILLISLLGGTGIFIMLNKKYYAFLGKYLFVVIGPIALFTCIGLKALVSRRWVRHALSLFSIILILASLDILFRVLKPANIEPLVKNIIEQTSFCCAQSPAGPAAAVAQTFICPAQNLCAIRIVLANSSRLRGGSIVFELKESLQDTHALYAVQIPADSIVDASYYYFTFPPIQNSQGRQYALNLTFPGSSVRNSVFPWYESTNAYHDGKMFFNGKPAEGDLFFSVYCFTGSAPLSPWEGAKPAVIDQGMYVNVKEMQFYDACSDTLKERTAIQTKMNQVLRAFAKTTN